ncbi:hypothetical protein CPB84DRAFT_1780030 [Gymnopilus junonius]|uniref:Uncharacterized protein n=1 Tax=Gymnopilus junonius TaxID=109634 RepID=A0A9P5NK23_GYMJU|nr:hypothetical protein CPB84DRAFT_1780030 [Gymnopilus junonius]
MGIANKPRLDGTRLIGVILEAVCYGILVVLLILCLSTLIERKKPRKTIFRPIFLITCLLFACISGHWIASAIELYQAFIPPSHVSYCVQPQTMTPAVGLRTVFTGVFRNERFARVQNSFSSRKMALETLPERPVWP